MKILIVDDARPLRMICMKILSHYEVELIESENGQEAYEKIHSEKPDLILLDIDMPKLTGLDLLKKLIEEGVKVNVVMVTARNEEHIIDEAFKCGALHYIIKPFSSEDLLDAINIASEKCQLDKLVLKGT